MHRFIIILLLLFIVTSCYHVTVDYPLEVQQYYKYYNEDDMAKYQYGLMGLIELINSNETDRRIKRSAIIAIGEFTNNNNEFSANILKEHAIPALIGSLKSNEEFVKVKAIESLEMMKPDPVEVLPIYVGLLKHDNIDLVCRALWAIRHYRDKAGPFLDEICQLLDHAEWLVRGSAIDTIKAVGIPDNATLEKLEEIAMNDPSESVRRAARDAIKYIREQSP